MESLHDPISASTPSQRLAAAARQARLHRFSTAASVPERLPGSVTMKAMAPIPNIEMAEAVRIVFPTLNRVESIQRATLKMFPTLTMMELKSARRFAKLVLARQIAMYLAKKFTSQSLPEIGRRFGGRDHTTVLHAVRKVEDQIQRDPVIAALVESIKPLIPEAL